MVDALGHLEWVACSFAEAMFPEFCLARREEWLCVFDPQCITDCKSAYDHITGVGSPIAIQDKRVAIDMIQSRESLRRLGGSGQLASDGVGLLC